MKQKGFPVKGAIAGVIVVVGAAVAAWLLWPDAKHPLSTSTSTSTSLIKEVMPANAPKSDESAPKAEKPKPKRYADMTDAEKLKSIRDKYGDNIPDNMKSTVYFLEHPVQKSFSAPKQEYQIFEYRSEEDIASLLIVEPGDFFLQKPFFDENFDRDFAKSLTDVITVTDEDTPRQAEIKKAVLETKKEMAIRVKEGEKASDIMNAAVEQMYELGAYKSQLQEMLGGYRNNPDYSDDDIRDFVSAANKMLESKGATPLAMPTFTMRQAKLRAQARRQEAKRQQEQQEKN